MPAQSPTILATSGGYRMDERHALRFNSLVHHAVELGGAGGYRGSGGRPAITYVGTANGDQVTRHAQMHRAAFEDGFDLSVLSLFTMPSIADVEAHLLSQDVVWVDGGSVANLLAVWQVHELGPIFRRAWEAGVVLAGVSAGSICWYKGGTTDSFGPELRPVTNGLALLPYDNGVHYDNEKRRRPLVHKLVGEGALGVTHCTDDGVGMVYRGTELVEAVTEVEGKSAWVVSRVDDDVVEEAIEPRVLEPVN